MKKVIILSFTCAILFACNHNGNTQRSNKDSQASTSTVEKTKVLSAEDVYKQSIHKVAMLLCYNNGIPSSQGSGFFIDKNTLVTNYHCVVGADAIEIKVANKDGIFKGAKVVKASEDYDLAIIRTKQDFPYLKIDSIGKEKVGSKIYAIGNPRGLEGTISDGILSGKRENEGIEYLQITAPISPGNSGGPVLNEKGEVIGVSTFTFKNSQNLNFAMPIKYIKECVDITNVKHTKSATIRKDNKAVTMTSFVKNEASYDAYFSIKNNTDETINNIYYVMIYKATNGEIIHYYEDVIKNEIAPHLAKQFYTKEGFGGWYDYSCNGTISPNPFSPHIKFKTEFRLISYEIEE